MNGGKKWKGEGERKRMVERREIGGEWIWRRGDRRKGKEGNDFLKRNGKEKLS